MNDISFAEEKTSLMPRCVQPYLNAVENIGIILENSTRIGVVITEAGLTAAELSHKMIQLRLTEVESQLATL